MKNQFRLKINQPCSENFNKFTPTLNGGYCSSCKSEVIDFSKMNPQEIANYFKNRRKQDICGRFQSNQLKTYTDTSKSKKRVHFWSGIGLACLSIFSFTTGQAQNDVTKQPLETTIKNQQNTFSIKGNVFDDLGSIAGVNVSLQGTEIGTTTDFDGYFEFPKKLKKGDILVFSLIGMKSNKVVITGNNSKLKINLKVNMQSDTSILMGKVAVKQIYKSQRNK